VHAAVARAIEEKFPEIGVSQPEILAHHLAEAGQASRAIDLWVSAGNRAIVQGAFREATTVLERALMALRSQTKVPENLRKILRVHDELYNTLSTMGELERTWVNLVEAEQMAAYLGDPAQLCRVLSGQVYTLAARGNPAGAIEVGKRALPLVGRDADEAAWSHLRTMLGRALYARGQYRAAIKLLHEVTAQLGDDLIRGSHGGASNQCVTARVWLTLCHAELGEFQQSDTRDAEAIRLADNVNRPVERLWSRVGVGRLLVVQGNFDAAIATLKPVLALCEGELSVYLSRVASSLGFAYAATGDVAEGLALLERATEHAQEIGFLFGYSLTLSLFGRALMLADQIERAQHVGSRALEVARQSGEQGNEAWALCALGEIAMAGGDRAVGEERCREALALAERLEMAPVRSSAGRSYGSRPGPAGGKPAVLM
jgi:tetratricopeptide (TPR) repeat protein